MGPGTRANASIGRALRLVLQNIGGAIPGTTDKATQGGPAKYGFCFAENEAESPWPPLRTTLGLGVEDSCVTVAAAEGPHNINDHLSSDGESILNTIAQTMATVGNNNLYVGGDHFVVFGPEHANAVAASGFSREDVARYLYEHARVPVERISEQKLEELTSWGGYAERLEGWGRRIPLGPRAVAHSRAGRGRRGQALVLDPDVRRRLQPDARDRAAGQHLPALRRSPLSSPPRRAPRVSRVTTASRSRCRRSTGRAVARRARRGHRCRRPHRRA